MSYSDIEKKEIFDKICFDISEGNSLRNCLKKLKLSSQTFFIWVSGSDENSKQYARATNIRADLLFDEIIDISDNQGNDIIEVDGIETTNHNAIQRNRLQIDARKWVLSKMNPKKYGEKSEIDLTTQGEKINQETTVRFINARKQD